jgi:hypothetical protein
MLIYNPLKRELRSLYVHTPHFLNASYPKLKLEINCYVQSNGHSLPRLKLHFYNMHRKLASDKPASEFVVNPVYNYLEHTVSVHYKECCWHMYGTYIHMY